MMPEWTGRVPGMPMGDFVPIPAVCFYVVALKRSRRANLKNAVITSMRRIAGADSKAR